MDGDLGGFIFGLFIAVVLLAGSHGLRSNLEYIQTKDNIEKCIRITTVSDELCEMIVTGNYVIPDNLYNENAGR
jgi:hypothetical protein